MSARAIATRRSRPTGTSSPSSGGLLSWVAAVPPWLFGVAAVVLAVAVLAGSAYWFYRSLDPLYPQELWRYFRPAPAMGSGTVLYRNLDGQLFLAPVASPKEGRRLLDPEAAARGREIVRDATVLPGGRHIAYYATERIDGRGEVDRIKIVTPEGTLVHTFLISEATQEAIRPAIFVSESGRYLGVTNRERTHVYYADVSSGGEVVLGDGAAPPERMLWNRNADLRTPLLPGEVPYATSPDGTQRAQVRAGQRRAPECNDARCEAGQELVVATGAAPGTGGAPTLLYGAFAFFSAEGWGPIPTQAAQRLYGRLVWSPDGKLLLFNTLDGAETNTYAVSTDGRTQPRLVIESGEALDWLP